MNTTRREGTPYTAMTTSSEQKTNKVSDFQSIEVIENSVLIIVNTEAAAKKLLKRNPRAQVTKCVEDGRYALVYNLSDCNLFNGVKRG